MHLKIKIITLLIALLGTTFSVNSSLTDTIDEKEVNLRVFPNPVIDGELSIQSDEQIKRVEILSIVGQIVHSQELEPSNSVRLYLDKVKSGIYLLKVSFTDNSSDTKRIWVK